MPFGTLLSRDRVYRYTLVRELRPDPRRHVLFVMLNPSTADESLDDPTIRRCRGFAEHWGFEALTVVNLFALRATDPRTLRRHHDPIGPANDTWIVNAAQSASRIIAAWGTHGTLANRDQQVLRLLAPLRVHCLGRTKDGHPRHPLYVAGHTAPELFAEPMA
jgi:hypothetical protein